MSDLNEIQPIIGEGGEALLARAVSAEKPENKLRRCRGQAPPVLWGPWREVASHGGAVTFTITEEPEGAMMLRSRVRYHKDEGEVVDEFICKTTLGIGNVCANVESSFKGEPHCTAVDGTTTRRLSPLTVRFRRIVAF